jgi:hypothetical protein
MSLHSDLIAFLETEARCEKTTQALPMFRSDVSDKIPLDLGKQVGSGGPLLVH